ncbi:MAG: hypothetical protein ACYC2H_02520 [Thermoplasmatota archaeon]
MDGVVAEILLVYALLVLAAAAVGFLALGGNALLYLRIYRSVPAPLGGQIRRFMRVSGALVQHRRVWFNVCAPAYFGGLALALVWPLPGLAVAFFGGVGLGFVLAAHLVQFGWRRVEARVPDGQPLTLGESVERLGEILPMVAVVGGLAGVVFVLAISLANRDLPWIPWLALAPLLQAVAGWAALRRRRRSSGPIRKAP